ncbi:MAG: flippase [Ruminococcus sp.]|nr:flippase [Ruminococcus sp.]
MSRIVKNYIYNVVYNIFVIIVPVITAPYLTRVLGATRLGVYSYVNSVTSIISSFILVGLSSYGSRQLAYVRDDKENLSKVFSNLMGLRLFLGLIGTAFYFVYAGMTDYQYYFVLYYIYFLGNIIDCTWLFVSVEDMKVPTLKNIMVKVAVTVGIFVFVKTKEDLWKYVFLLAAANLFGMIVAYPQLKKYVRLKLFRINSFWRNYKGAVILFLPSLVSTIYLQMDKVMIEWLTKTTNQVLFYDQAEKIVTIPLSFITVLSTVMMPRIANEFAHRNYNNIEGLLVKASRTSLILAYPLMFGIAGIAKRFIPWYLGEEFTATATALILLAPIVTSNTLIGISGTQFFIATGQTNTLLLSNSSAAIMNVVVNALLIPRYGYVGAAVATLLSNYTLVVIQYAALNRQIDIRKMFYKTSRYLLSSLFMFLAVLFIGYIGNATPLTTFIQVIAGGAIYFVLLIMMKDDLFMELIRQVLKK